MFLIHWVSFVFSFKALNVIDFWLLPKFGPKLKMFACVWHHHTLTAAGNQGYCTLSTLHPSGLFRTFAVLLLRLTDRPFDSKLSWRERRRQFCLPAVHSWRQESYLNNSPLHTCRSHSPLTLLFCVFSQLMLDHIPTPSVHVCLCVRILTCFFSHKFSLKSLTLQLRLLCFLTVRETVLPLKRFACETLQARKVESDLAISTPSQRTTGYYLFNSGTETGVKAASSRWPIWLSVCILCYGCPREEDVQYLCSVWKQIVCCLDNWPSPTQLPGKKMQQTGAGCLSTGIPPTRLHFKCKIISAHRPCFQWN